MVPVPILILNNLTELIGAQWAYCCLALVPLRVFADLFFIAGASTSSTVTFPGSRLPWAARLCRCGV